MSNELKAIESEMITQHVRMDENTQLGYYFKKITEVNLIADKVKDAVKF